jgi:hypothetical protein
MLCSGSFNISPAGPTAIDTSAVARRARGKHKTVERPGFVRIETDTGVQITIMQSGNAIVKGVSTSSQALHLYQETLSGL